MLENVDAGQCGAGEGKQKRGGETDAGKRFGKAPEKNDNDKRQQCAYGSNPGTRLPKDESGGEFAWALRPEGTDYVHGHGEAEQRNDGTERDGEQGRKQRLLMVSCPVFVHGEIQYSALVGGASTKGLRMP